MRERVELEREMFNARQDLEENLDLLAHKVRERLAFRARAGHALRQATHTRPALIAIAVAALALCGAAVLLVRRRMRPA